MKIDDIHVIPRPRHRLSMVELSTLIIVSMLLAALVGFWEIG